MNTYDDYTAKLLADSRMREDEWEKEIQICNKKEKKFNVILTCFAIVFGILLIPSFVFPLLFFFFIQILIVVIVFFVKSSNVKVKRNEIRKKINTEETYKCNLYLLAPPDAEYESSYRPERYFPKLISINFSERIWRPEFLNNIKLFKFEEVMKVEVVENNTVVTTYDLDNINAGLGFGRGKVRGYINTGNTSGSSLAHNQVNNRILRVYLNRDDVNNISIFLPTQGNYYLYRSAGDPNGTLYSSEQLVLELLAWFERIMQKKAPDAQQPESSQNSENDGVNKLRELKQLLEEGIITQEDFDIAKAKYLSGSY